MKLQALLFQLTVATTQQQYNDDMDTLQPALLNVLQTQPETPDQVELEVEGSIPAWLDGSFYRNGPGKFEFGNDQFAHLFDPMALVQRFAVANSSVSFNSQYIQSRNYRTNTELGKIVFPELGTAAEPDWVNTDENGNPLSDEEIIRNRWKFFIEPESKTDNTLVSLHSLCGNLIAFSETMSLHALDMDTLNTLRSFSIEDAANYPDNFIGMTQTPHGQMTSDGDFVNMMAGLLMEKKNDQIRPPKVAYFMYRIRNAAQSTQSIDQILSQMEFSEPTFNEQPHSMKVGYMHQGTLAGDYFLAILSSTVTDMSVLRENTINGLPLLAANRHDPEREQEVRIFNLRTFEWEQKGETKVIPKLPAGIMLHTINGQVVKEDNYAIRFSFDGLWSGNPSVLSLFYLDSLRQHDAEFEALRQEATPSGVPKRIEFTWFRSGRQSEVSIRSIINTNDDDEATEWAGYGQGGIEFPTINSATRGQGSRHFWGVGYAQVLGDRLYHTDTETGERWVYRVDGYEPAEPVFVQTPGTSDETDGVLISVLIPIEENKRGFFVVLDAATMNELGRAWMPADLNLATAFHSLWL